MKTCTKDEWQLPINQTGYHLALTADGLFRLKPTQVAPAGSERLYPGKLHAWHWFEKTGRLRPEYLNLPVWEG